MWRSGEDAREMVSCSARERSVERPSNPAPIDSEKRRADNRSGNLRNRTTLS